MVNPVNLVTEMFNPDNLGNQDNLVVEMFNQDNQDKITLVTHSPAKKDKSLSFPTNPVNLVTVVICTPNTISVKLKLNNSSNK